MVAWAKAVMAPLGSRAVPSQPAPPYFAQGSIGMSALSITLKWLAPVFVIVAGLHLALGLGADALLGAQVPASALAEPSLSSQNRFYGVSFALYGVMLYIAATDLARYELVLKAVLVMLFLGGAARLAAWAEYGAPAPLVIALLASELLAPPLLWAWLARLQHGR